MRSEINGIESWHGIVPRKPRRNPSAYYGRTSKATSCRPRAYAAPARAGIPRGISRFRAFLREELQLPPERSGLIDPLLRIFRD